MNNKLLKKCKCLGTFSLILFLASCVFAFAAEELTIATFYPAPRGDYDQLRANRIAVGPYIDMPGDDGALRWGWHESSSAGRKSRGILSKDQGASIELGGTTGNPITVATPYIDFHNDNDAAVDYDARIMLRSDDGITINVNDRVQIKNLDGTEFRDLEVRELYMCSGGTPS